jgi:hypothetical protein
MAAAARHVVERDYRLEVVAERVWRMVTEG